MYRAKHQISPPKNEFLAQKFGKVVKKCYLCALFMEKIIKE